MTALDITTTSFLKWSLLYAAISWLAYRFYQVVSKPLEELAAQLGFDIPSTPQIALAALRSNGAIIHFSLPDKQKPKNNQKFEIYLNGANIATIPVSESSVTITGLQPATFYVARVGVVNSADFASRSTPIHFRTKLAVSNDYVNVEGLDAGPNHAHDSIVRVTPYRGLKDIAPPSPDVIPMSREGSSGVGARRNTIGLRRPSPSTHGTDKHGSTSQDHEQGGTVETIQQLTERLDAIRMETEEVERIAKEDEEEDMRVKEALVEERDRLKVEAMEATRSSKNLKNEVQTLERQNTVAQNERTKWHKIFEQKKQERQKMKDDVVRWERETAQAKLDMERIEKDKEAYSGQFEREKEELATKLALENASIKNLEDELKAKTLQIKQLENDMKNGSTDGAETEPSLVQQLQQDAEEQRQWDMRFTKLQQEYARIFHREQAARQFHDEQMKYLQDIRARRRAEESVQYSSPPPTQERDMRNHRTQSGHSSNNSPSMATFKPLNSNPFGSSMPGTSSIFAPPTGSFMGTTPTDAIEMSDAERERMTGGALMSPGAGANLIPKDLFNEYEAKQQWEREQQAQIQAKAKLVAPLPGLGAIPDMTIPGLGHAAAQSVNEQKLSDQYGPGPASPGSETSRSQSLLASPHASQQNLHVSSPDHILDVDRQSVRSVRSNRATSGGNAGSRFSGMFGIKSRSKAPRTDEGPPLGKIQSHSLPRYDDGIPGIDSHTRKRNSSISGSVFDDSFGADPPYGLPSEAAPRRRAFNLFQKDTKVWPNTFGPRPASPRPASTHSNELPRPSTESSRWIKDLWTLDDATNSNRISPLGFGAGWNPPAPQNTRLFPSRQPSRRASTQYGVLGPYEDIPEDDTDADVLTPGREAYLPPIGTKPSSSSRKAEKQAVTDTTKLNPAAKDFRSLFSGMKPRDKAKQGSTSSATGTPNLDGAEFGDSPPASRKSKDNRDTLSLTTTESSFAESGRESPSLARTPSYTNSETAPSPFLGSTSAQSKESFMAKLTRKSSSGKFSLPTFKRDKIKLDANTTGTSFPAATSAPSVAEDDEDAMSASVGSSRERDAKDGKDLTKGSGRGWGNVLKLGRKKGNETPSVSGMSMTSGGTAEDDGDAGEEVPASAA